MLKLVANIAVWGLAMANAPDLFARLNRFQWYGGTLRNMIANLNLPANAELLEIGCGPGGLARDLASAGYRVTGIDSSSSMVQRAEQNQPASNAVQFLQADALNMPIQNEKYDVVIAASLLNVVKNKQKLISEMMRVTKVNGIIMVVFPTPRFTKNNATNFANSHNLPAFEAAAIKTWASLSNKLKEQDVVSMFKTAGLESVKIDTGLEGMLTSISGVRD
ncbi:MAG: class I SAM-dependent methyltransferase [Rhizobiales bacterium]|nr:class I SAM-dependent methyltransferase [Hyphomicrobiales bacterium]